MRTMLRTSRWLTAAAVLLVAGVAQASGARAHLDTFTRGLTGLEGQFTQQVSDGNGRTR